MDLQNITTNIGLFLIVVGLAGRFYLSRRDRRD